MVLPMKYSESRWQKYWKDEDIHIQDKLLFSYCSIALFALCINATRNP